MSGSGPVLARSWLALPPGEAGPFERRLGQARQAHEAGAGMSLSLDRSSSIPWTPWDGAGDGAGAGGHGVS